MDFDFDKEFKGVRKYYGLVSRWWQNFFWMIKFFLKRHDTLATDQNINPEEWNDIMIKLRDSYKTAFEVWCKQYMYDQRKVDAGKVTYKNPDELYSQLYDELSQKGIRFLIDFICTVQLEDTIYRELFSMWAFEFQFLMNAGYNPDRPNYHVLYCSSSRDDMAYYIARDMIKEEAVKKMQEQGIPQHKMSAKFHQALDSEKQKHYGMLRIKQDMEKSQKKIDELKRVLKDMESR